MTDLQTLLKNTAEVYRNLVQHANAAGIPVPEEAQMGGGMRGPGQLDYDEFAAANATDWEDFQDEGRPVLLLTWLRLIWLTWRILRMQVG